MSNGQGNISFSEPPGSSGGGGGGIDVAGARNGLTVDGSNFIVLGQDVGEAGALGSLLNPREVPLNGQSITFDQVPSLSTSFFKIDGAAAAMLNYYKGDAGEQPAQLITIQGQVPGGNPYGNFWMTLDETFVNFDGQRDAVVQWGYNQSGTGGNVVASEAAIHWAMESHYVPTSPDSEQFEVHLQSLAKSATVTRHFSMEINKLTGIAQGFWTAESWQWNNAAGLSYWQIDGNGQATLSGAAPELSMVNTDPTQGQLRINSAGGPIVIENPTTSSDSTINFSNDLVVSQNSVAFPALGLILQDASGNQGLNVSGTVTGNVSAVVAGMAVSGQLFIQVANTGAGDASFLAVANTGNSQVLFFNGASTDLWAMGLHQSDGGKFKIAIGSGVGSPNVYTATNTGQTGIGGQTTPTALLHIPASSGAVGMGPLKLTEGTLLAVPEDGLFEYDGTNLFFTVGATRKTVTLI
jgi:hypothetical protein